jgi:hypothetical protein
MKRFVEGTDRRQATLFPECLADRLIQNVNSFWLTSALLPLPGRKIALSA